MLHKIVQKSDDKRPLYVLVYDQLFSLIKDGYFSSGENLPPEKEMAEKMGISRGTLRQALLILQKDGLIKSYHGKGNFVAENNTFRNKGLEHLNCIMQNGYGKDYELSDIEVIYEPPNTMLEERLQVESNDLLVAVHRIYNGEEGKLAYGFSIIPHEQFKKFDYNLKEKIKLAEFLDDEIYISIANSRLRANIVKAGEYIADKLDLNIGEKLLVFEETCYDFQERPLMYFNIYIIPEYFVMYINRRN